MNPSANGTACQMVSIEIKEVTPREARKAKTEAECRGSLTTESEGTISHLHQLIAWNTNLLKYCRSVSNMTTHMGQDQHLN